MSGRSASLTGGSSVRVNATVYQLWPQTARRLISEASSRWTAAVEQRLDYLCNLPEGWNGYRAGPVKFSVARFTYAMLQSICGPSAPAPTIVPGPSGDLQVEWHLVTGDIELHVRAPNDVHAWRETLSTGEKGEELELRNDFTEVVRWINELGGSEGAPDTAAA